jgi:putative phage-type endonuclease
MSSNKDIQQIITSYYCFLKPILDYEKHFEAFLDFIKHIYEQFEDSIEVDFSKELLEFREHLDDSYENLELIPIIQNLKTIKQPAQRTPEWYEYRSNRLTASDLGTAMGINPYCKRNKLIAKKCGYEETFYAGPAIKHGIKYEDVAIHIYEQRNHVNIFEYGCIPHPTISHFGASPDGICDTDSANKKYIGRMLEIKCPKSRVINEFIPEHYELQVQGQLEVCNLDYCDYLECSIREYDSQKDFLDDSIDTIMKTKNGMEKGVVIETYDSTLDKNTYFYLYNFENKENINNWVEERTLDMKEIYIKTTYWKLEVYSVKLVKRDRERFDNKLLPEINSFWEDVLKYRECGYESLVYKHIPKELNFLPDSP